MTLEMKLKRQKEREAAKNGEEPKNKDRFYCKNNDMRLELLKWRNSDKKGIIVQKLVDDKLVKTKTFDTPEQHEQHEDGVRYFVKISKEEALANEYVKKLVEKAHMQLAEQNHLKKYDPEVCKFYKETPSYYVHEITSYVKKEGWTFNYDLVEERTITNTLGEMMMKIGKKLLNHSNFRNYSPELKEDMLMMGSEKLIRGLKNYNFRFSNPFAWFSMSFWNAYLTVIYLHYKQMNIKKALMKKLSMELQTFNGIDPRSSLNKAIKQYLGSEFSIDD